MRIRRILPTLIVGAILCGPLAAQPSSSAKADTAEMNSSDAPVTFTTRTNLVLVPVVVHDAKGKGIGGLRQDDFQLFDRGKPQIISRFTVENPRSPKTVPDADPAALVSGKARAESNEAPSRFVAYLFDDMHARFEDLARLRMAAGKHFEQPLPPATRVAIFTASGQTTLEFTDDRLRLRETLDKIQLPTVTRLDGEQDTRTTLIALRNVISRLSAAPGSRSAVLVSTGFFLSSSLRADETETIDRAIRAHVTVSALDLRGLYALVPGGDATQIGLPIPAFSRAQIHQASANGDVLAELADGTGGKLFHNDNSLKVGFDQLSAPPDYVYVLGFSPQNLKLDGAFHELKVSLRSGKGLELQARRGYYAPAHAADPAEQAREEVREAIFSLEEMRDLPADLNLQFFKSGDYAAKLTVLAKIDLKQLRFQKAEDRNRNTLTLVTAVFDQNGSLTQAIQKTIDLKLRDQTLDILSKSGVTVRTVLDVTPGHYVVRLVVRDSQGETMAARSGAIEIP